MSGPVVCAPLAVERAALGRALGQVPVHRTGRGPARSTAAAAALSADGPRPVLVAGVCGGLDAGMVPGDVVVASEVRGPDLDPVPVPGAAPLTAALRGLGLRVHTGPVVSVPRVGLPADGALFAGAVAVDTESAWLAAAAAGGPVAVVRTVVDTPTAPLWRPGTPTRGVAALRALRRCRPALRRWLAATGPRTVALAAPRSFCAGVERAIDTVEQALRRHGGPVYVRRQIVHNRHVVRDLERRGAVFVQEVDEVPPGAVTVLAAHGVSPAVRGAARERGLAVVDATCPLVAKVHGEVRRHARDGETVFLIGHADHEEVEGTRGEAPGSVVVVDSVEAAARVQPADPARVAYAMQTTLAVDEAEAIAAVLRSRFPAIAAPRSDDICYATTNRQQAVRAIAARSDLVLVLGSSNSSNSLRLVEVAAREGAPAHLIDDVAELDLDWLAGSRRIGVSAGASAPRTLVDELIACLSGLGPTSVTETVTTTEDVRFTLPKEVS